MSTNRGAKENVYQHRIDEYERRARNTGNLVYVWMAIAQARAAGFPMPEWCRDQINYWAVKLYELAHLLDPDKEFSRLDGEDDEAFAERIHARWKKREISSEEALKKAKTIFGFSQRGWNAFNNVMIDQDAIDRERNAQSKSYMPSHLLSSLPRPNESDARMDRRRRKTAKNLLVSVRQKKTPS